MKGLPLCESEEIKEKYKIWILKMNSSTFVSCRFYLSKSNGSDISLVENSINFVQSICDLPNEEKPHFIFLPSSYRVLKEGIYKYKYYIM